MYAILVALIELHELRILGRLPADAGSCYDRGFLAQLRTQRESGIPQCLPCGNECELSEGIEQVRAVAAHFDQVRPGGLVVMAPRNKVLYQHISRAAGDHAPIPDVLAALETAAAVPIGA